MNEQWVIPGSWARTTIEATAEIGRGVSFRKDARKLVPQLGHVACLRTANVQREVEWGDLWFVPEEYVKAESRYVQPFDILISVSNSLELVGKVAQVTIPATEVYFGSVYIATSSFIATRRTVLLLSDGLHRAFNQSIRYSASTTTNISNVSSSKLSAVTLKIPPLAEQRRIVAEIETQFTRLDASVAALRRAQANLKRYRASVKLRDACEGRLVATEAELARSEGREYEPAAVLLEHILAERRARWESQEKRRGKYKEPSAPDTSDLPQPPEGWVWATVEQLLVEPLANGRSVKTANEGFPVLRLTALQEGEINQNEYKIGNWTAEQASSFLIQKGDFLVSRGNGSVRLVGIGGLVREVDAPIAYPDTLIRFRLTGRVLESYFSRVWNSSMVRTQIEQSARTTAGIHKVNQQDLSACTIPLPPLAEQRRIVAEVERRLSVIQQAEATVEASLARAERLRQSILKQAFSGRLVPQDPDDEPASVLLERIRAEREAEAQSKGASKGKSRARKAKAATA